MKFWGTLRARLSHAATGLSSALLSDRLVDANLQLIRQAPMEYLDEIGHSLVWY